MISQKEKTEIFHQLSSVFAHSRSEANNITIFRARDRFSKNLATVNHLALTFFAAEFPHCSMAAIRNALAAFEDHLQPSYAALYALEHELPQYEFGGWVPSLSMRLLNKSARKVAKIKDDDPKWTTTQKRELKHIRNLTSFVTCPICFDSYPIGKTLRCQPKDDKPGSSATHSFCYNCIRGVAREAADGSGRLDVLGIPCMSENCRNVLYWNEVRTTLPNVLRRRLSDMVQNENLRATGIEIESCKFCGFSGMPELPKEEDQVFQCPNCGRQHCRLCGEKWTEEHQGRNCEDLQSSALRRYQEKLTDAVLRVCKHCGLSYEKKNGCNRIVCRCGTTYCYLCRKENVNYEHFCIHTTEATPEKCKICKKSCRLWATPTKFIRNEVARIKEEAKRDPRISGQVSPVEKMFKNKRWEK